MKRETVGFAMASYYGGRAEVRVRKVDVPVIVVDFTSMYPTVFLLQNLQELIASKTVRQRDRTWETQALLKRVSLSDLYEPALWRQLRTLVRIKPNGDILPVRMRENDGDPYTISVTHFTSDYPRWYTLADVIAAKLLGGKEPEIEEAVELLPGPITAQFTDIDFLGTALRPGEQIFKTVIEERQRAKRAKGSDSADELARRDLALKILANSGAYGIFAEINVEPLTRSKGAEGSPLAQERVFYSDVGPRTAEAHDERPGSFFNPIIATLVTGGARLMLAMLEAEVSAEGGTFAFCDTDSLAIVAGEGGPPDVPCLPERTVLMLIKGFNRLNPYNPAIVPSLLKREYANIANLRCFAISAKRYVLFTCDKRNGLRVVKASESGLGAAIGRTSNETVRKLARRIWTAILVRELHVKHRGTRAKRMRILLDFEVPFRRRFPITQPRIYETTGFKQFNRAKSYDFRIKPYAFLQAITPAAEIGDSVQPIAPFERALRKSRRLIWTDLRTGKAVKLDWDGNAHAATVPVMRLDEFIAQYADHPESKAAGPDGLPATAETRGVLGRLHLTDGEPARIGKEVDRLGADEGDALDWDQPVEYEGRAGELDWAIEVLAARPRQPTATALGISVRRLQDILNHHSSPRSNLGRALLDLARRIACARSSN